MHLTRLIRDAYAFHNFRDACAFDTFNP